MPLAPPQLLHIVEHRTEVRAPEAAELHGVQVGVELLLRGDLHILLHLCVALEDVQVDFREEALLLLENVIGLLHELLHQGVLVILAVGVEQGCLIVGVEEVLGAQGLDFVIQPVQQRGVALGDGGTMPTPRPRPLLKTATA